MLDIDQAANNVVILSTNRRPPRPTLFPNTTLFRSVTDTAMSPSTTTSGITSTGNDVKLTVQAGGLSIGQAVSTGAGDLTLNVAGAVTQTATGVITGTGLDRLSGGTGKIVDAAGNRITQTDNYSSAVRYLDVNTVSVRGVTDMAMGHSAATSGITSAGNDVKLTVQAGGLSIGAGIATGAGDLTLNVVGPVTQTLSSVITGTG